MKDYSEILKGTWNLSDNLEEMNKYGGKINSRCLQII